MRKLGLAAMAVVMVAGQGVSAGAATVLFECGASDGWEFYPGGGLVPKDRSGWTQGGISNGRIQLVISGDNDADLIHLDAAGINSARSHGAEIILVGQTERYATVLVSYADSVKEMYTYDMQGKKLFWTQHKFGVLIDKLAAFTSDCI